MVSTQLKNISQNGNLPQIGVKIKTIWNHHLVNNQLLPHKKKNKSLGDLWAQPFWGSDFRWRKSLGSWWIRLSASNRWGKKSGKLTRWGWVCVSNDLEGFLAPSQVQELWTIKQFASKGVESLSNWNKHWCLRFLYPPLALLRTNNPC